MFTLVYVLFLPTLIPSNLTRRLEEMEFEIRSTSGGARLADSTLNASVINGEDTFRLMESSLA